MRRIIIALIASAGVLSSCSDFLGTDPDNRTYIDTPEKVSALLAETDIPVRDAAAAAGFSNESYFYTLFRKRFGTTPGEYRSRFRL